jgi:hypothetical protein
MEMAKNMRARSAGWIWMAGLPWLCLASPICAQPPSVSKEPAVGVMAINQPIAFYGEGYVLLQHGNVMHGFVKPQADRVTIVIEKGKEVTLANKQVLAIGKSLESLYDYQIKGVRKWGTGEHWHLAQWCIQNNLLDQAIEHYSELEKTAADNPRFKQLDHQLKEALLADTTVRQAMSEQGIEVPERAPSDAAVAKASTGREPRRLNSTPNDPAAGPAVVHAAVQQPLGDPHRILPSYLRRSFQTEIQPVVVSRCGQSGCHGMLAKNDFQVFQPVGEQAASMTERNLETILRYVDADAPLSTTLIQHATRPHGTQRNPSINPNRDEDRVLLDKMVRWLQTLSEPAMDRPGNPRVVNASASDAQNDPNARVASAVALIPKSAVQRAQRQRSHADAPGGDAPVEDRNAKLSKPPKSAPPPTILNAAEIAELESVIAKLEKMEPGHRPQQDPLDPREFNSKYSGGPANKPNP